ncbi:Putative fluoride ion transporter CrcB [uncultured archaeon]|nr:Putative fluoride ion transporter CrcB [uncultured archaeon]
MLELLAVAIGGALGALSRYALGGLVQNGHVYPWGTFSVNALGSFGLGLLMYGIEYGLPLPSEARLLIGVGFIGAFTTFSTFSYETFRMLDGGDYAGALANLVLSLCVGLAAIYLGKLTAMKITGVVS